VPPEPRVPLRLVVGTAGHIDHGKTALVAALTGIDTDRLPEEKARGITIELGFAPLVTAAGDTLAVIDVPGHERFVRTMVAGATGIDLVLLIVAADEGIMPQTREHLDICALLGITRGLIAVTKVDLVEPSWLALVTQEISEAVKGTFLEQAAIVPCSAVTGAGLPALRGALERLAAEAAPRASDGPLRLPIDRVFTVKGFGTVVTGTLATGHLREGDDVVVLPEARGARRAAKVRGIEVHGEKRPEALAGERTAANLHGLERAEIERGAVLIHADEMQGSTIVDVELTILPICPTPIPNRARVLFHALATQENALLVLLEGDTVAPGQRALAQLRLQRPAALLPGDRFILRGFQPLPQHGTTIGGGRVVRVLAPRRRRDDAAGLALLRRMAAAADLDERIALEVEAAGTAGVDRAGLRARVGAGAKRIERALEGPLARREAITFYRDTGGVVSAVALARVGEVVVGELARFHAAHPVEPGIAREALRTASSMTRALDPRIFAVALSELVRRGAVEVDGEQVRRRGFSPRPAEAVQDLVVGRVRSLYRDGGLAPPWSHELAARVGASAPDASTALEILVRRGELVRVKADLCFDRAAVDAVAERLRAHLLARGQITPQEWKELTGQSRKYTIPLAEYFDAAKLTLRVGEIRRLRGGSSG
jgi:selenocysteine-specific elongation factor